MQGSSAYRCGGSAGWASPVGSAFLLPVELRAVNWHASTNAHILITCFDRPPLH